MTRRYSTRREVSDTRLKQTVKIAPMCIVLSSQQQLITTSKAEHRLSLSWDLLSPSLDLLPNETTGATVLGPYFACK